MENKFTTITVSENNDVFVITETQYITTSTEVAKCTNSKDMKECFKSLGITKAKWLGDSAKKFRAMTKQEKLASDAARVAKSEERKQKRIEKLEAQLAKLKSN